MQTRTEACKQTCLPWKPGKEIKKIKWLQAKGSQ
jgi:hypothetical protein